MKIVGGPVNCLRVAVAVLLFFASQFPITTVVYAQAGDKCLRKPVTRQVSPIVEQQQKYADWCSVAASRVVTSHYNLPISQNSGQLAEQCEMMPNTTRDSCCQDPGCHPQDVWPHHIFNEANFTFKTVEYVEPPQDGPTQWSTVVDEICRHNRALISIASVLDTRNWHAVVINGYRIKKNGEQKVKIYDPQESAGGDAWFENYDRFFLSGYDHYRDYIEIMPKVE